MKTSLSASERNRYNACKKQVSDGLQTCFDTGAALSEIRDSKLYREDFDTFEEFCKQTYQLSRPHAYRLIESAEVKQDIAERSPQAGKLITNEAQARALADVPSGAQVKLLKELAKTGEPITAEAIKAKTGSVFNATAGTIERNVSPIGDTFKSEAQQTVLDHTGLPVPKDLLPLWKRVSEVQQFLTQLSHMRGTIRAAQDAKDLLWGGLSYPAAEAELAKIYTTIECAKPYAVCPRCQGSALKTNCTCCKGRGVVSQYLWNSAITREEKMLRSKLVEKLTQ